MPHHQPLSPSRQNGGESLRNDEQGGERHSPSYQKAIPSNPNDMSPEMGILWPIARIQGFSVLPQP